MKKIKLLALILTVVVLMLSLCGCQLKKEDISGNTVNDRLIGAFITTEYLGTFDVESYLEDNIGDIIENGGEITAQNGADNEYQNKIYAKKVKKEDEGILHEEYVFDIDGHWVFDASIESEGNENYTVLCSEGAISDIYCGTNVTDDGTEQTLEGKIYYTDRKTFYLNPVYQEADGDIYTVAGQGISSSEGRSSTSIADEKTITDEEGNKTSYKTSIKMNFESVSEPKETLFIFMRGSEALSEINYKPDSVPEKIKAPVGAEYLIVLERSGESTKTSVFGKEEDYAKHLVWVENGICEKRETKIEW